MSPRVRFEDEAEAEYRQAGRWYEERSTNLAFEFLDAVDETIERIVEHPRAGSLMPGLPANVLVRRIAVRRFPYNLMYLEAEGQIRILAVAHDRRKPGYCKARL